MKGLKDDSPYDSSIDSKEGRRNAFSLSDRRLKKKKRKKKGEKWNDIYNVRRREYVEVEDFRVSRKLVYGFQQG